MRRALPLVAIASLLVACAAAKGRDTQAPSAAQEAAPATGGASAQDYGQPSPQQAPAQPGYAPPPPATPAPTTPAEPGAGSAGTRAVALQQASSDIDAAQRELDVSGGDCRHACRALGSMDRAAGRVCSLTREDTSHDRCDDAKRRLYGARDRVRSTCGACPDGQPAVERNAPVPSVR